MNGGREEIVLFWLKERKIPRYMAELEVMKSGFYPSLISIQLCHHPSGSVSPKEEQE